MSRQCLLSLVTYVTEAQRILNLPQRQPPMSWTERLRRHKGAPRLTAAQDMALTEAFREGALLGMLGAGAGKTLLSLLLPEVLNAQRPVLLTYKALVAQHLADREYWRVHYNITSMAIVTYEELSGARTRDVLHTLAPDVIILDEGAAVRRFSSARAGRLLAYVRQYPTTSVSVLSASLTGRSVLDIYELAELALRDRSPFPIDTHVTEMWASVLDPKGEPDAQALAAMRPFGHDAPSCRHGVYQRLMTCPGVVMTQEASTGVPLTILRLEHPAPASVTNALKVLEEQWKLPDEGILEDGAAIVDALTFARAARSLSLGFYYRWEWPNGVVDNEWLEARNAWNKEVRDALTYRRHQGYDSALLVRQAAELGKGTTSLLRALAVWKSQEHKTKPEVKYVFVDGGEYLASLLQSVAPNTLIWHSSLAISSKLTEYGVPVHGAGSSPPVSGTAGVSIRVHGVGKHLVQYSNNLVLEPPASGDTWEQLLSRTVRMGQAAMSVTYTVLAHTRHLRDGIEKVIEEARYIQSVSGNPQKLLTATWETA